MLSFHDNIGESIEITVIVHGRLKCLTLLPFYALKFLTVNIITLLENISIL